MTTAHTKIPMTPYPGLDVLRWQIDIGGSGIPLSLPDHHFEQITGPGGPGTSLGEIRAGGLGYRFYGPEAPWISSSRRTC
jgi:hypothetical protein